MVDRERGIVTPEAVLLEFETAGVGSRAVAMLLDVLVQLAAILALVFVLGAAAAGGVPELVGTVFVVIALFLILLGYPIASETLWSGRTLGKAAMGLRVVTREGAPVRFRHAAIRGALSLVDIYISVGAVAVVTSLLTKDGQRLGDLSAGTLVLRERTAAANASSMVFPVPYGWEAYVASLDVSAITTEQYGVIRDFLLRVDDLAPNARAHLAIRVANPVAVAMNHQPPNGVPAESFLVCVAAAFQQRRAPTTGWSSGTSIGQPSPAAAPPPPPGATPVSSVPPPPGAGPVAPATPTAPDGWNAPTAPPVSPTAPPVSPAPGGPPGPPASKPPADAQTSEPESEPEQNPFAPPG